MSVTYKIEDLTRQAKSRRFRTQSHVLSIRFTHEREVESALPFLDSANQLFPELFRDVFQRLQLKKTDFLRLQIDHEGLKSPLWFPFEAVSKFDPSVVADMLDRVQQSNENFSLDQKAYMSITTVSPPSGFGRGRLTRSRCLDHASFLKKKRSLIRIENRDELCFARALVVAIVIALKPGRHSSPEAAPGRAKEQRKQFDIPSNLKHFSVLYRRVCRSNRGEQYRRAWKLHEEAGVSPPCQGAETWEAFQKVLEPKGFKIVIYSKEIDDNLLYEGEFNQDLFGPPSILHLYHHHDHYDVISNLKAFKGYAYFCETCKKGYTNRERHRCIKKCEACFMFARENCPTTSPHYCSFCARTFFNSECFKNHKQVQGKRKHSICHYIQKCKICGVFLRFFNYRRAHRAEEPHQCGERFCKVCHVFHKPEERWCYMHPEKPPPSVSERYKKRHFSREKPPPCFVFYDFETRKTENNEQVPNLCVIQLGCHFCSLRAPSSPLCKMCSGFFKTKQRQFIFAGDECLKQTTLFLLNLGATSVPNEDEEEDKEDREGEEDEHQEEEKEEKEEEEEDDDDEHREEGEEGDGEGKGTFEYFRDSAKITCFAHNAQGFDNYFILQGLHKFASQKPKIILKGGKILSIKLGRLKFLDSLSFLPMALKKLPETFNLKELRKGFFPHHLNTKENERYIGSWPCPELYGVDEMKAEERAEFLHWHSLQQSKTFDMQKELLAYCISDVDILRRSVATFRDLSLRQLGLDPFEKSLTLPAFCSRVFRTKWLKKIPFL